MLKRLFWISKFIVRSSYLTFLYSYCTCSANLDGQKLALVFSWLEELKFMAEVAPPCHTYGSHVFFVNLLFCKLQNYKYFRIVHFIAHKMFLFSIKCNMLSFYPWSAE